MFEHGLRRAADEGHQPEPRTERGPRRLLGRFHDHRACRVLPPGRQALQARPLLLLDDALRLRVGRLRRQQRIGHALRERLANRTPPAVQLGVQPALPCRILELCVHGAGNERLHPTWKRLSLARSVARWQVPPHRGCERDLARAWHSSDKQAGQHPSATRDSGPRVGQAELRDDGAVTVGLRRGFGIGFELALHRARPKVRGDAHTEPNAMHQGFALEGLHPVRGRPRHL
mmetsp:Transcript_51171/g.129188  ORF Transcript_51171/g.129188 Transcript_51171/m.129188 type:complete len:231 (+) Transcript_51171:216-908(+)